MKKKKMRSRDWKRRVGGDRGKQGNFFISQDQTLCDGPTKKNHRRMYVCIYECVADRLYKLYQLIMTKYNQ